MSLVSRFEEGKEINTHKKKNFIKQTTINKLNEGQHFNLKKINQEVAEKAEINKEENTLPLNMSNTICIKNNVNKNEEKKLNDENRSEKVEQIKEEETKKDENIKKKLKLLLFLSKLIFYFQNKNNIKEKY